MVHKQDRQFLMYTSTSSHEKVVTLREMMKYMKRWEETHSFVGYTSSRVISIDVFIICVDWWEREGIEAGLGQGKERQNPGGNGSRSRRIQKAFCVNKVKHDISNICCLCKQSAACGDPYLKYCWRFFPFFLNNIQKHKIAS